MNLVIALKKKSVIMKERSLNSALVAGERFTNSDSLVFFAKAKRISEQEGPQASKTFKSQVQLQSEITS